MVAKYLKDYFQSNGINNSQIARRTGMARSKISLSLNGKRKITADELFDIAIIYDINLESIKKEIKTATKQ